MVQELDAGPVYLKKTLSLEGGSAEEIYMRAGNLSVEMIEEIITEQIIPRKQEGAVTLFKRREAHQSALQEDFNLETLYNHIRMLDAEGYPKAFLDFGNLRFTFSQSSLYSNEVRAHVSITPSPKQ